VHAQVNEDWVSDFGGVELDLRALSPHEWDYIALGHVHLHRQVGLNAAYSGALEHTANNIWAEAKEVKGFLEVHLPSAKRTFHPLTTPRDVVVLEPLDALEMTPEWVMEAVSERINAVAGGIDGKIARLDIRNISRETYRNLNHKELRALKAKALNLSIDISFVSSTPAAHAVGRPGKGLLRDELQAFCATWQVPGVTHEELSSVLLSYVTKIEAKYEAS
jgi:DNA repair exonuclease SbcCD nuclease subunit